MVPAQTQVPIVQLCLGLLPSGKNFIFAKSVVLKNAEKAVRSDLHQTGFTHGTVTSNDWDRSNYLVFELGVERVEFFSHVNRVHFLAQLEFGNDFYRHEFTILRAFDL